MDVVFILLALMAGALMGYLEASWRGKARLEINDAILEASNDMLEYAHNQIADLAKEIQEGRAMNDKLQSMLATAREGGYDPGHTSLFEENEVWSIPDHELEEEQRRAKFAGDTSPVEADVLATMRELDEYEEPREPS